MYVHAMKGSPSPCAQAPASLNVGEGPVNSLRAVMSSRCLEVLQNPKYSFLPVG